MFLRSLFLVFALSGLLLWPAASVYAQDESSAPKKDAAAPSDEEAKLPVDPVAEAKIKALNERLSAVSNRLDKNQARHFFVMYSNYTIISTVRAVEKDVQKAVETCAENNRDLRAELNARFSSWQNAVDGPMKEAMGGINNMIAAQNYASRDEIEDVFRLVEETREYNSSRFEKIPVSTKEACEFMMSKMRETQGNMAAMLKATLVSYPATIQRDQQ